MRAIINNKLYDTDKSEYFYGVDIPQNDVFRSVDTLYIYKTAKGNIFAEDRERQRIITESMLKTILQRPDCVDIYVEIFGEVEEA